MPFLILSITSKFLSSTSATYDATSSRSQYFVSIGSLAAVLQPINDFCFQYSYFFAFITMRFNVVYVVVGLVSAAHAVPVGNDLMGTPEIGLKYRSPCPESNEQIIYKFHKPDLNPIRYKEHGQFIEAMTRNNQIIPVMRDRVDAFIKHVFHEMKRTAALAKDSPQFLDMPKNLKFQITNKIVIRGIDGSSKQSQITCPCDVEAIFDTTGDFLYFSTDSGYTIISLDSNAQVVKDMTLPFAV
ncbi:hypothetical protein LENED_005171 [Lentinula edodes]|uniref:Uncharacterized protein n=1 Tax=Lentinula edodes TaxID=5353 RepID=A0A1Q3E8P1_LENED|nr:hypothetical protein LENED_005171 [Lentinula edodes]